MSKFIIDFLDCAGTPSSLVVKAESACKISDHEVSLNNSVSLYFTEVLEITELKGSDK